MYLVVRVFSVKQQAQGAPYLGMVLTFSAIGKKETMDEEFFQATLNNLIERLSRLEKEMIEVRQFLFVQKPCLERLVDGPVALSNQMDISRSEVTATDCWEVTCLGSFRLRYLGRDLALCSSRRAQSILKYLLASPGYAASSEALIECFWPQVDPEAGTHSLQVAIHTLRRSLRGFGPDESDETVLFGNNRYFLNPSLSIVQDVDSFRASYECGLQATSTGQPTKAIQAFEKARALYTGDYLANCYEGWASSRRLALIDMRLSLLCQLGSLYSQGKEWELAISCYWEILLVDNYREDIYRQLMGCYAACGRHADIKRAYRSCRECLRRDLRLAPAPETTRLYQQLIQHEALLAEN